MFRLSATESYVCSWLADVMCTQPLLHRVQETRLDGRRQQVRLGPAPRRQSRLGSHQNFMVYATIRRFSSRSWVSPFPERKVTLRQRTLTPFNGPLCTM